MLRVSGFLDQEASCASSLAALVALPLAGLAAGPVRADWTPVQLGPGGPIIEQDWGLYRPGHGSPRMLDGPILMPVPRPIGMPEPMRRHFELHYQRRGVAYPGMPGTERRHRAQGHPALAALRSRSSGLASSRAGTSRPGVHYFPGGVEEGDQPAPKPAAAPKPAEPFFRMWSTPTMPDAVLPQPTYEGPDSIALPDSQQQQQPQPPRPPGPRPRPLR